ncbi:MAG: hypothetical protein PHD68_02205 [Rugosibacter sp.]|nr:hypothetical protein [Rugosibacter sp.]
MTSQIIVTQLGTGFRLALDPCYHVLHQPRLARISIGKPAFQNPTFMSVFAPQLMIPVKESYEKLRTEISDLGGFSEYRHGETGTLFLCKSSFFHILEPGARSGAYSDTFGQTTLVSIFDPTITVPIVGAFEDSVMPMVKR